MSFTIADPLGLTGAPALTLQALQARFEGADLRGARLILLTDRQGERLQARYAVLVEASGERVLTAAAFGPHYGKAGMEALRRLAQWGDAQGLPVRETVLNASDFNRVVAEPDAEEVGRLVAASNPSDYGIYLS
ncbi:DUF3197 domain-containing protein [Deinococcus sonorensis]|uniref:DUF3197 domain-containing protein n=2 Tax=Deinococcus sonorensis TaxID=309891 RepID=A0AAU7UDB3_9DEIO